MKNIKYMLAIAMAAFAAGAQSQPISVTVDGVPVNFRDVEPTMIHGRVMVPLRGVFEQMGAYVMWNDQTQTVVVKRNSDEIRLPIGSMTAWVNGDAVQMDTPATTIDGRAMVPLRFLGESLKADVNWIEASHLVQISTVTAYTPPERNNPPTPPARHFHWVTVPTSTVIPFKLNERLSSNNSTIGETFTATIDNGGNGDYQGLPDGSVLEGHVSTVRAKNGDTPGVLGLAFDRIRLPGGAAYNVNGSLIGLDSDSVVDRDGRLVAKRNKSNDNMKYVGYGAGGGAILSVLTRGNFLSDTIIGGALGWLYGEIQKDPSKSKNVRLQPGDRFGVRLKDDLSVRVYED